MSNQIAYMVVQQATADELQRLRDLAEWCSEVDGYPGWVDAKLLQWAVTRIEELEAALNRG